MIKLHRTLSRRQFSRIGLGLAASFGMTHPSGVAAEQPGFSFMVLGDLHFDRWEHHDFAWLDAHHPQDLSQIKNYSRITSQVTPALLAIVRTQLQQLAKSPTPPAFVIQVGDLVEGLCGNEALAVRQNTEAIDFIRQSDLNVPFLMTKGNHDITGDGANEAFRECFLPFLRDQAGRIDASSQHDSANYRLTYADTTFAFLDAYDPSSLDWLESMAHQRSSQHFVVIVHPPVVPYGARSTWHLYSDAKQASKRAKLLDILGRQQALVIGGHLHKFSWLTRRTGGGLFHQLAISSVVDALTTAPRDPLQGREAYTSDQVSLEPQHAPDTIELRRAIYDQERTDVTHFEYANLAGYAVVKVGQKQIEASIYSGSQTAPYRVVALSQV